MLNIQAMVLLLKFVAVNIFSSVNGNVAVILMSAAINVTERRQIGKMLFNNQNIVFERLKIRNNVETGKVFIGRINVGKYFIFKLIHRNYLSFEVIITRKE